MNNYYYKIISCIAATTNNNHNDIAFTLSNLNSMCYTINTNVIYITDSFAGNAVGMAIDATVKNNSLYITCKIKSEIEKSYIVPGFKVVDALYDNDNDKFKYTNIKLVALELTYKPIDLGVTMFKEIK